MTAVLTPPKGTTMTPLERARVIEDPLKRVKVAAELARKAEERAERARQVRDMAACVAHLDDGVPPVEMYRDVLECSRGLFVRIIQRAPAERPDMKAARRQAAESAKAARRHEEVIEGARALRDETILLLLNGGTDPVTGTPVAPISNADVARATGLTTARVAQVRTGAR